MKQQLKYIISQKYLEGTAGCVEVKHICVFTHLRTCEDICIYAHWAVCTRPCVLYLFWIFRDLYVRVTVSEVCLWSQWGSRGKERVWGWFYLCHTSCCLYNGVNGCLFSEVTWAGFSPVFEPGCLHQVSQCWSHFSTLLFCSLLEFSAQEGFLTRNPMQTLRRCFQWCYKLPENMIFQATWCSQRVSLV